MSQCEQEKEPDENRQWKLKALHVGQPGVQNTYCDFTSPVKTRNPGKLSKTSKKYASGISPANIKLRLLMSGKIPVRLKKITSLLCQRCFALRTLPAPIRKFIGTFADKDGSLVRVDLAAGQ
jgi:hypothetical protein